MLHTCKTHSVIISLSNAKCFTFFFFFLHSSKTSQMTHIGVDMKMKKTCAPPLHQWKYKNTMCRLNPSVASPDIKALTNALACKQYYSFKLYCLNTSAARRRQQPVKESFAALSIIESLLQHQLIHAGGCDTKKVMKDETSGGFYSKLLQQTTDSCFFPLKPCLGQTFT